MENKNGSGNKPSVLSEELLTTWLTFTSAVRNERIVKGFTFREILILHILCSEDSLSDSITATDIVNKTGMLKPQVNKLLDSLESRRLITRRRSDADKRYVLISPTASGRKQYLTEHRNIIALLDELTGELGTQHTRELIENMNSVSIIMDRLMSGQNTRRHK